MNSKRIANTWKQLAIALCTCLLFLSAPINAQDKRPMSFADVMAVKNAGGTKISPDGKRVIYTLSYADLKGNENHSEIWMVAASGGKARRFTSGKNDRSPEWSPDGEWIAFLAARGDAGPGAAAKSTTGEAAKAQVHLISPFGGEAEKLTDSKTGVTAFAWSPDSKKIAFVAQRPLSDVEEKRQKDKDDAIVFDTNFRFSHLWIIDIESEGHGNRQERSGYQRSTMVARWETYRLYCPSDAARGRWLAE